LHLDERSAFEQQFKEVQLQQQPPNQQENEHGQFFVEHGQFGQ